MFEIVLNSDNYYNIVFISKSYILCEMGTPPENQKFQYDDFGNKFTFSKDLYFANKIGYEEWQLQFLLAQKFNGIDNKSFTEFEVKEEAERAKEWIESLYIAHKLSK